MESLSNEYGIYIGEPQPKAENLEDECGIYMGEPDSKPKKNVDDFGICMGEPDPTAEKNFEEYGIYMGEPETKSEKHVDDYGIYMGEPEEKSEKNADDYGIYMGEPKKSEKNVEDYGIFMGEPEAKAEKNGSINTEESQTKQETTGSTSDISPEEPWTPSNGEVNYERRYTAPSKMALIRPEVLHCSGLTQSQTSIGADNPPYTYGNQLEYSIIGASPEGHPIKINVEGEKDNLSCGVPDRSWCSTSILESDKDSKGSNPDVTDGQTPAEDLTGLLHSSESTTGLNIHTIRERHSMPHVLVDSPNLTPKRQKRPTVTDPVLLAQLSTDSGTPTENIPKPTFNLESPCSEESKTIENENDDTHDVKQDLAQNNEAHMTAKSGSQGHTTPPSGINLHLDLQNLNQEETFNIPPVEKTEGDTESPTDRDPENRGKNNANDNVDKLLNKLVRANKLHASDVDSDSDSPSKKNKILEQLDQMQSTFL